MSNIYLKEVVKVRCLLDQSLELITTYIGSKSETRDPYESININGKSRMEETASVLVPVSRSRENRKLNGLINYIDDNIKPIRKW